MRVCMHTSAYALVQISVQARVRARTGRIMSLHMHTQTIYSFSHSFFLPSTHSFNNPSIHAFVYSSGSCITRSVDVVAGWVVLERTANYECVGKPGMHCIALVSLVSAPTHNSGTGGSRRSASLCALIHSSVHPSMHPVPMSLPLLSMSPVMPILA